MKDLAERLLAKREVVGDCWLYRGARDADGYGRINLDKVNTPAHRAAWIAFRGDPGEAHVPHNQECSSRACFNPSHLHLGTHRQNMRERDSWGSGIRGTRVASNRLSEQQVQHAKDLRAAGRTWPEIAQACGVHPSTVRHAVSGRNWRHLKTGA